MVATNKVLREVERPSDAKGPIETLKDQKVKLEAALKWAEGHVEFTEKQAEKARQRKQEIVEGLELTEAILKQHDTINLNLIVENDKIGVQGVVNVQGSMSGRLPEYLP